MAELRSWLNQVGYAQDTTGIEWIEHAKPAAALFDWITSNLTRYNLKKRRALSSSPDLLNQRISTLQKRGQRCSKAKKLISTRGIEMKAEDNTNRTKIDLLSRVVDEKTKFLSNSSELFSLVNRVESNYSNGFADSTFFGVYLHSCLTNTQKLEEEISHTLKSRLRSKLSLLQKKANPCFGEYKRAKLEHRLSHQETFTMDDSFHRIQSSYELNKNKLLKTKLNFTVLLSLKSIYNASVDPKNLSTETSPSIIEEKFKELQTRIRVNSKLRSLLSFCIMRIDAAKQELEKCKVYQQALLEYSTQLARFKVATRLLEREFVSHARTTWILYSTLKYIENTAEQLESFSNSVIAFESNNTPEESRQTAVKHFRQLFDSATEIEQNRNASVVRNTQNLCSQLEQLYKRKKQLIFSENINLKKLAQISHFFLSLLLKDTASIVFRRPLLIPYNVSLILNEIRLKTNDNILSVEKLDQDKNNRHTWITIHPEKARLRFALPVLYHYSPEHFMEWAEMYIQKINDNSSL